MPADGWRSEAGAIVLSVRLTPKAHRDEVGGWVRLADGHLVLQARVRAPPAAGEANRALCRLLGKIFEVPKSDIAVIAGAGARLKQVRIAGDAEALAAIAGRWSPPA